MSMIQFNDIINLSSSLSEKTGSKSTAESCKSSAPIPPAAAPTTPSSPNTRAAKARQALLCRFTAQVKRVMWRAEDVQTEVTNVADSLDVGLVTGKDIDATTERLAAAQLPAQIRVHIDCLDGTSHAVQIQPAYISALDVNKFGADFSLRPGDDCCATSAASIADLKLCIQAATGVPAAAQILYFYDGNDGTDAGSNTTATAAAAAAATATAAPTDASDCDCEALDDDEPITALQARGLADGSRLHLVVDADRHYWQLHRRLAATFRKPLLSGYRAMLALMPAASARTHGRAVKFCRTCRRALAFLGESRAAGHRAREVEVVGKVERHMVDTILPILRAVAARLRLIDERALAHRGAVDMDEGEDEEIGADAHRVLFGDD